MKMLLTAAALAATTFAFAGPAAAMPVDVGVKAGTAGTTQIAWYCNRNGRHCVRAPRRGYAFRGNCNWNGRFCAPIVVAPRAFVPRGPAPRVVVRPNRGKVVIRP